MDVIILVGSEVRWEVADLLQSAEILTQSCTANQPLPQLSMLFLSTVHHNQCSN